MSASAMSTSPVSRGDALVAAVRAKGSDAKDPRDAAHEVCHALKWGVTKAWTRDNIHARKPRRRSEGVADEILARAVEQLVSADVGHDTGGVEAWVLTCWMETLRNEGIALPSGDWLETAIRRRMKSPDARQWADRVLELAEVSR